MSNDILKEWENKSIPDFNGKKEFVNYLTQLFISNQMKTGLTDYIQSYVEIKFKNFNESKWPIAISLIKNNYKYFRMIGWTELDYNRCISLCVILNKMFSKKELLTVYNDYKCGLYDNYFLEEIEW